LCSVSAAPGVLGGSNILFFSLSTKKFLPQRTKSAERCATQRKDYISEPLKILNTDPRGWVKVGSN
jgi:hypothetical protein